jgi:hypothetical protein
VTAVHHLLNRRLNAVGVAGARLGNGAHDRR